MEYREGHIVDGRYSLQHFIGSGSYGEVWVAKDIQTDMEIAIKIYISMDQHGIEEFKKEFQVSFDLNQTNLLHSNYLGVNAADSRPYLIMPYCPEGSVSSKIGHMSEKDLWVFIRDVASGLAYLHGQNPPIIHQDIKPDNILISRTGDYLITDFGISRQVRNTLKRSLRSASVAGAPAYMGPERFSGNPMPVKASDIWSLGATIYELATGELPFCGMGGVMQKNGADMTELPPHYSDAFKTLVYGCLAQETWDRPAAKALAETARRQLYNLETIGDIVNDSPQTVIPAKSEAEDNEDFSKTRMLSVEKDVKKTKVLSEIDEAQGLQTISNDSSASNGNSVKSTVMSDCGTQQSVDTALPKDALVRDKNKSFGIGEWIVVMLIVMLIGICGGVVFNLLQ